MIRKLLVVALVLSATTAFASPSDPTDAEVLALAGPKTCKDGTFTDVMPRQLDIPIVDLDPNILYEYCFRLPRVKKSQVGAMSIGFVELKTANLANTSCGTASGFMIRPKRKSVFGKNVRRTSASMDAVEPSGVLFYTPGTWRVLIQRGSGECNKYSVTVTW